MRWNTGVDDIKPSTNEYRVNEKERVALELMPQMLLVRSPEDCERFSKLLRDSLDDWRGAGFGIGVQLAYDVSLVAINEAFGIGAKRGEAYTKAFDEAIKNATANMIGDVRNGDANMTWACETLDARLRQIYGDDFPGFDDRFNGSFMNYKGLWYKIRNGVRKAEDRFFGGKR